MAHCVELIMKCLNVIYVMYVLKCLNCFMCIRVGFSKKDFMF